MGSTINCNAIPWREYICIFKIGYNCVFTPKIGIPICCFILTRMSDFQSNCSCITETSWPSTCQSIGTVGRTEYSVWELVECHRSAQVRMFVVQSHASVLRRHFEFAFAERASFASNGTGHLLWLAQCYIRFIDTEAISKNKCLTNRE